MSQHAANLIAERIRRNPKLVLGLATGSTPLGTYQELARMYGEEGLDFSGIETFNLDEYVGIGPNHPQSYHFFMKENFFKKVNIKESNSHLPDALAQDIEAMCASYEESIKKAGGIDVQLLGIGRDGHIAFNEPGSSLGSRTRIKTLAPETVSDNARFFRSLDEVPRFAITMGVGTILEARELILLASGKEKADAVRLATEGPIASEITASVIQLHPRASMVLDEQAASLLKRKDYYNYSESMRAKFGQGGS
jgi:glucosamine-6-phosphate deaminase